jgi:hypothetical protein
MAAPAVSRAGNPPLTSRSVELHLSYIELREFCAQLEKFKTGLHGAALGYHSSRFALPGVDGTSQVSLKFVVRRAGKNLRRNAEAQKAWCPPSEENAKRQAQLALQTPIVKRSFEHAFPGDKLEAARAALCDMLEDRYARKNDKSVGINYRDKSASRRAPRAAPPRRAAPPLCCAAGAGATPTRAGRVARRAAAGRGCARGAARRAHELTTQLGFDR